MNLPANSTLALTVASLKMVLPRPAGAVLEPVPAPVFMVIFG